MAAPTENNFEEWLCTRLLALNTDPDVFGSYMKGILEGDETLDEKIEALASILEGITESNTAIMSREIADKYEEFQVSARKDDPPDKVNVEDQLATLLEQQLKKVTAIRTLTAEETQHKNSILAQYSQVSDDEEDPEFGNHVPEEGAKGGANLSKNTNGEDVARAERDKRGKAKADSERKKQQDKTNR